MIKNPAKFRIPLADAKTEREGIELAECVPFAQYKDYGLLRKLAATQDEEQNATLIEALSGGWKKVLLEKTLPPVMSFTAKGLDSLYSFVASTFDLEDTEHLEIPKKVKQEAGEQAIKKEKAVDSGKYKGVDEQEKELGKIDFPNKENEDR